MKPTVLLMLAHPDKRSFGGALAEAYLTGLQAQGCNVEVLHLPAMDFDATPAGRPPELEPHLVMAREAIVRAKHIVLVYPTWLGAMPARLKGFFERTFTPDFAFRFKPGKLVPEALLSGRSADILVTMDTPPWIYRWVLGAPGHRLVRHAILGPSGMRPLRITTIGPLRDSTEEKRRKWLERTRSRAAVIGKKLVDSMAASPNRKPDSKSDPLPIESK